MPMGYAAAAAGSAVIGGIAGNIAAAGDRAAQRKAISAALAELRKVGLPPDLSAPLLLKEFQKQGIYTPELEQDLTNTLAETKLVTENISIKDAQLQALNQMKQAGRTGMTAETRAALNQVGNQVEAADRGRTQSILQSYAAQGMGTSGNKLQALLAGEQASTQEQANRSMSVMGDAQRNALNAIAQSANMASGIRSQDYNVNAANANAINERNRFLYENSVGRQSRNVQTTNAQRVADYLRQGQINDANTALYNQELNRQQNAKEQNWQNKLAYGQAIANAQIGQAGYHGQQAANTAGMWSGLGSAIGGGFAAYGQGRQAQSQMNLIGAANGLTQNEDGDWVNTGSTSSYNNDYMKGKTGGY